MTYQIVPAPDRQAALRVLAAVERFAVDGATAVEIAEGCELLDVLQDGRRVGVVALAVEGQAGTIKAAAGQTACLPGTVAAIEDFARARGARRLAFFTRRPGLLRRMLPGGYRLVEAEVEKEL